MMLRELISSGQLSYATVQPTGPNGKLEGVTIGKEGPVAFIMTTARENVEEELLTRLLVTVTDETDRQTQNILDAVALAAAGQGPTPVSETELAKWRALQDWLRLGPRDVLIPFAPAIAQDTDRRSMRIRRDFPAVLSMIQASALLHRAQRVIDQEGRIIAEMQDYAIALAALDEGLEELAHGDTAQIEAVRYAVDGALRRAQRAWSRSIMAGAFREVLHGHLVQRNLPDAAKRLEQARQSQAGRERTDTVIGCIEVVTLDGRDTAVGVTADRSQPDAARLQLYRAALVKARKARETAEGGPVAVELSGQRLANLLGIGRQAARVRLDNAVEAGAIIDVGATDRFRPKTAPRLLAPGTSDRSVSTSLARRGAFPSPDVVRQSLSQISSGDGRNQANQGTK